MAYRCKDDMWKECDGCGSCMKPMEKETGVKVEATIKLEFVVYGEIERVLRGGDRKCAEAMAQELIDDTIDCCGLAGEDMTCESFTMELDE